VSGFDRHMMMRSAVNSLEEEKNIFDFLFFCSLPIRSNGSYCNAHSITRQLNFVFKTLSAAGKQTELQVLRKRKDPLFRGCGCQAREAFPDELCNLVFKAEPHKKISLGCAVLHGGEIGVVQTFSSVLTRLSGNVAVFFQHQGRDLGLDELEPLHRSVYGGDTLNGFV
jgi:hypothetical protein